MRLSQWFMLIGAFVAVGCLTVAQRNAVYFQAYAVGDRLDRLHTEGTAVAWLRADVLELSSPSRLSQVAEDRRLKFIAWSTLPPQRPAAAARAPLVVAAAGAPSGAMASED